VAVFGGKKFIFIVSSGRTGTKAIAQHLSRCYPQVWAEHEPAPSWRLRMGTTRALCGKATREELKEMLVKLRRGLVERTERGIYVESNSYLSGFIEVLGEVFEGASVVHVVRDPRTYVRSGVNFGAFRGMKKLAAEFWPNWFPKPQGEIRIQNSEFRREPSPQPSPGVPGEGERGEELKWGEMDAIERLAWFWSLVNSHLNRGEQVYGQRYLRVKFEELFSGDGLERLTDWMGLPRSSSLREEANKERVNASTVKQLPEWEKWCGADQHKVLSHCEKLMRLYGYLKEESVSRREAVEVS